MSKPSRLCATCRDCDGKGYSSPDPCERCHGRGWLPVGTRCNATRIFEHADFKAIRHCTLEPWHDGQHQERGRVNDGDFFDPRWRGYSVAWSD